MGSLPRPAMLSSPSILAVLASLLLVNVVVNGDYGGLRRRSWGRVHMMRSGKRGSEPEHVTEELDHDMDDTDYMFEPQDQMLYEVSKRASGQNGWHDFLRQLRSNAGVSRGGRRSWFGGVHMLRSGKKRSYWPAIPQ